MFLRTDWILDFGFWHFFSDQTDDSLDGSYTHKGQPTEKKKKMEFIFLLFFVALCSSIIKKENQGNDDNMKIISALFLLAAGFAGALADDGKLILLL